MLPREAFTPMKATTFACLISQNYQNLQKLVHDHFAVGKVLALGGAYRAEHSGSKGFNKSLVNSMNSRTLST